MGLFVEHFRCVELLKVGQVEQMKVALKDVLKEDDVELLISWWKSLKLKCWKSLKLIPLVNALTLKCRNSLSWYRLLTPLWRWSAESRHSWYHRTKDGAWWGCAYTQRCRSEGGGRAWRRKWRFLNRCSHVLNLPFCDSYTGIKSKNDELLNHHWTALLLIVPL